MRGTSRGCFALDCLRADFHAISEILLGRRHQRNRTAYVHLYDKYDGTRVSKHCQNDSLCLISSAYGYAILWKIINRDEKSPLFI